MKKATFTQRIEVMSAHTDSERLLIWQKMGFTQDEAEAMVKGSTKNQCIDRLGGVWRVGNIEWVQAISKDHAIKLHTWNFGDTGESVLFVK